MTDHKKALPRLSDELKSFQTRFGPETVTCGLVLANVSETFVSPGRNGFNATLALKEVSAHRQPGDTDSVIEMVRRLPRRPTDTVGIVFVDCPNDRPLTSRAMTHDAEIGYDVMVANLVRLLGTRLSGICVT